MGKESRTIEKGSKYVVTIYTSIPDQCTTCKLLHNISKRSISFSPCKVDKPLVLYGAGNLGKMAKEYFDKIGIPFLFVIDTNPDSPRKDPFWKDVRILEANNVPIDQRESCLLAVCVATTPFSEISIPLKMQGWNDIVPFYDITCAYNDIHPLDNGWYVEQLNTEDVTNIEFILSKFEDNISRAHYLQFIAWHCLREEWFFDGAPVTTDNRYFIPEVLSVICDHEIFVDIGAHHGEVIYRFLDIINNKYNDINKYGDIYAIEPDKENFDNLVCIKDTKIHLLQHALGSEIERKRFYQGLGYTSQLSELGQVDIDVICLDDLLIPATFIKIHAEGWEYDIINGGLDTIINNRPILTITSYHNRKGLWNLPNQIMTKFKDYIYYFRLHSWHGTGSVIYAIPKERII